MIHHAHQAFAVGQPANDVDIVAVRSERQDVAAVGNIEHEGEPIRRRDGRAGAVG
ncbi:MAG: hypothetical protein AB7N61_12145 [Acidimicrobiia bacterium]